MTRNDIIYMAREAGLYHFYDSEGHCTGITDWTLVDEEGERNDDRLIEILAPFAALVAAAEREECAKVCDEAEKRKWLTVQNGGKLDGVGARHCAEAIRARGEK